eukprot:1136164-Pelagomonas_calceolata.AAC.2
MQTCADSSHSVCEQICTRKANNHVSAHMSAQAEGVELMWLMLANKRQSRFGALKLLDYAATRYGAPCEKLVDLGGLKHLFGAFMGKAKIRGPTGRLQGLKQLLGTIMGEAKGLMRRLCVKCDLRADSTCLGHAWATPRPGGLQVGSYLIFLCVGLWGDCVSSMFWGLRHLFGACRGKAKTRGPTGGIESALSLRSLID